MLSQNGVHLDTRDPWDFRTFTSCGYLKSVRTQIAQWWPRSSCESPLLSRGWKIYLLRRDRMLGKPEDIVLIKNPIRVSPRKTKLTLNRKISVCRYVKWINWCNPDSQEKQRKNKLFFGSDFFQQRAVQYYDRLKKSQEESNISFQFKN